MNVMFGYKDRYLFSNFIIKFFTNSNYWFINTQLINQTKFGSKFDTKKSSGICLYAR
jgi:hypothetical protein